MDDLGARLQSFLSQPGAMDQVAAMARQLGLESPPEPPQEPPEAGTGPGPASVPVGMGGVSPELLQQLSGAFSAYTQADGSQALLEALGPHLGGPRREKLQRAARALGLMRAAKAAAGMMEL